MSPNGSEVPVQLITVQPNGAAALYIAVRHGLAEYIYPVYRGGCWLIRSRAAAWNKLSRAIRESVSARRNEDFRWELGLELESPATEAGAEASPPSSPSDSTVSTIRRHCTRILVRRL